VVLAIVMPPRRASILYERHLDPSTALPYGTRQDSTHRLPETSRKTKHLRQSQNGEKCADRDSNPGLGVGNA